MKSRCLRTSLPDLPQQCNEACSTRADDSVDHGLGSLNPWSTVAAYASRR
jgi:hypothetical protein